MKVRLTDPMRRHSGLTIDPFQTNIYGTFFLTRAAVPHMPKGSSIIVTASQVAYAGPRTCRRLVLHGLC